MEFTTFLKIGEIKTTFSGDFNISFHRFFHIRQLVHVNFHLNENLLKQFFTPSSFLRLKSKFHYSIAVQWFDLNFRVSQIVGKLWRDKRSKYKQLGGFIIS